MDTSTLAAIWAAIISTCAFFAYVLVEYPKITANWKALNKIAVEFSQKNRAMVKFFALLSFFGSEVMAIILLGLLFHKDYKFEFMDWILLVIFLLQFVFWSKRTIKYM